MKATTPTDRRLVALIDAERATLAEDRVAQLRRAALADGTRARYGYSWDAYVGWCGERSLDFLSTDARQLTVWLHERFDTVRPGTLRNDANAAARAVRDATGVDLMRDVHLNRLLNASARFHGIAPDPANVVTAFTREELVAMIAAPIGWRGMMNADGERRGLAALLLLHLGAPLSQAVRIATDGPRLAAAGVAVMLPEVAGQGVHPHRRIGSRLLTIEDAEIAGIDPMVLVDLAAVPVARRRLFALGCAPAGDGRYTQAITVATDDSPAKIAGAITSQLRGAARRAGLGLHAPEELAGWAPADVARVARFVNPAYLVELRTRAHAAVLAALGARHDDLTHVRVETMRRRPGGWELRVDRSKTDQAGLGDRRLVPHTPGHPPTCPACLLGRWLDDARLERGPLFPALTVGGRVKPTPLAVEEAAEEFQRLAAQCGIGGKVGTHSFRKTHVTLRAANGEEAWAIARTTRQSPGVVHRNYVQAGFDTSAQL